MARRKTPEQLATLARQARRDILRMVHRAKSGHTAGPLSCIDILTVLYANVMNYDLARPNAAERDRFILSVGHVCPALYAILAAVGFVPRPELDRLRQIDAPLQGHPKYKPEWGIDMSTGSLGQGMSVANGLALAARLDKKPLRVYSLESDGGAQEGMFWEGAMAAGNFRLDNRCAILDWNNIQIDGYNDQLMDVSPLADKFRAFKWHVISIDGHDFAQLQAAFDEAAATQGKPTMIVAKTVAGKGVSFIEGDYRYHGVPLNDDELARALKELGD